jgi:hypothetical protein
VCKERGNKVSFQKRDLFIRNPTLSGTVLLLFPGLNVDLADVQENVDLERESFDLVASCCLHSLSFNDQHFVNLFRPALGNKTSSKRTGFDRPAFSSVCRLSGRCDMIDQEAPSLIGSSFRSARKQHFLQVKETGKLQTKGQNGVLAFY